MKPVMSTLSPASTRMRVEMLARCESGVGLGGGVGLIVGIGVEIGVAVGVAVAAGVAVGDGATVGVAIGVAVAVAAGVAVAVAVAVGVGVAVAVAVGVGVGVGLGFGVGAGVGVACTSTAPMSARPFTTRAKPGPRGSILSAGSLPSITGLSEAGSWVKVGPPLFCNGPSLGSVLIRSPGAVR